jgi:hypothetical protein
MNQYKVQLLQCDIPEDRRVAVKDKTAKNATYCKFTRIIICN